MWRDTTHLSFADFNTLYTNLTGHDGACRWQYRLFTDFEAGRFPTDIELATGLGKTSIIALWVLALGRSLARKSCAVPRRLAYVVDRRVVVDQASEFAEQVCERLEQAAKSENHTLHTIATTLKNAGCTSSIVEVSTLRGQRALDTRWRNDPTRPAIIVGTVDMIGSRLLFSAYGRVGPWGRALEAGLVGQDCLVVLDEAHLCSPFAATLTAIERIERRVSTLAPFAVVRMGATMEPVRDMLRRTPGLPEEPTTRRVFRLLDEATVIDGHTWPKETDDEKVSNRLNAKKRIEVEALDPDRGVGAQLAEWAIQKSRADSGAVIGIVVNTVTEVRKCVTALREHGVSDEQVVTLTGSMRGWDRDAVAESEKYARFKSQRDRTAVFDSSIFLVATSCVEVGADIDCDHLGVEACAGDSLIQRLGRVNRLGLSTRDVTVRLVGDEDANDPAGEVFRRVQALVADGQELQGSPATFPVRLLDGLNEEEAGRLFDVRVPPPALTSAVLDDFAMTSKHPNVGARPDVGRWLHGSVDDSSLYVELAWRAELDRVTEPDDAERLLAAFPVGARETARCPLHAVVKLLEAIRGRAIKDKVLGERVLLVTRYGETKTFRVRELPSANDQALRAAFAKKLGLRDLPKEDDRAIGAALHDATVVLPTSAGGYDGRFVDPASESPVQDIAEE
ncbi:MAG: type I-U CRISPR-associated helicase/endonuclease Cas3, partial [Steroidobacteraceae bacterium]|nr:type I-U CRISPR-associated helicase/endonuclease Cas3 [Steroidobacteraceae bacterium]